MEKTLAKKKSTLKKYILKKNLPIPLIEDENVFYEESCT